MVNAAGDKKMGDAWTSKIMGQKVESDKPPGDKLQGWLSFIYSLNLTAPYRCSRFMYVVVSFSLPFCISLSYLVQVVLMMSGIEEFAATG